MEEGCVPEAFPHGFDIIFFCYLLFFRVSLFDKIPAKKRRVLRLFVSKNVLVSSSRANC